MVSGVLEEKEDESKEQPTTGKNEEKPGMFDNLIRSTLASLTPSEAEALERLRDLSNPTIASVRAYGELKFAKMYIEKAKVIVEQIPGLGSEAKALAKALEMLESIRRILQLAKPGQQP